MIGIVTPLGLEAKCLGSWAPRRRGDVRQQGERIAIVSGVGWRAATEAADKLVRNGATSLISFGTAGALDRDLLPGTLLLPRRVISGDTQIPLDESWGERIAGCLEPGERSCQEPLAHASEVQATVDQKKRLRGKSGAAAVDMESAAVAAFATEHGLPCVVVRVIADAAWTPLPDSVIAAVDEHGEIRAGRVLRSLVTKPQDFGPLISVFRSFRRAQAMLERIARRTEPRFLAPVLDEPRR
ncbi:MAG: hypothetical protein RL885_08885 [Planctomycetota bacterium]